MFYSNLIMNHEHYLFTIDHRQHNKRASHSCCIALQHRRVLRSGGTMIWRDGRKDDPQTTVVSLFRVRSHGIVHPAPCPSQTEPLPGMPRSLANGSLYSKGCHVCQCQCLLGTYWPPIPSPFFA